VSWLTGDSFSYSFHIGKFQSHSHLGSKRATIEIREKSRIGRGFRSEPGEMTLISESRSKAIAGWRVTDSCQKTCRLSLPLMHIPCGGRNLSLISLSLLTNAVFSRLMNVWDTPREGCKPGTPAQFRAYQ
jgi:hypothetical protein